MSPDRVLLTVGTLLLVVLLYALMAKGWRGRKRRQGDLPPPPAAPEVPGQVLVGAVPGLFVGTTFSDDWLDRVAVHELAHRSAGWLEVTSDGVIVEREGLNELYLPYASLDGAELGDALAGKVIGRDGLLLLHWRLGGRLLTSGFRADDHGRHTALVEAIGAQLSHHRAIS